MTGATDAVVLAIRRELDGRRALLDASGDVAEVTITVKLQVGTTSVRGVVYQEQRLFRVGDERRRTS